MKADTERKRYHTEKLHRRKSRLHVHLSKELRSKLKKKKRSLLVRKGDTVRVMRGPGKGREAKVTAVNTVRRKVFVEDVAAKTAKGREVPVPLEPSNLLLLRLEPTPERKEVFSEDAFKKKELPKKEAPKKAEAPLKEEGEKETAKEGAPVKEETKEAPAKEKKAEAQKPVKAPQEIPAEKPKLPEAKQK